MIWRENLKSENYKHLSKTSKLKYTELDKKDIENKLNREKLEKAYESHKERF